MATKSAHNSMIAHYVSYVEREISATQRALEQNDCQQAFHHIMEGQRGIGALTAHNISGQEGVDRRHTNQVARSYMEMLWSLHAKALLCFAVAP